MFHWSSAGRHKRGGGWLISSRGVPLCISVVLKCPVCLSQKLHHAGLDLCFWNWRQEMKTVFSESLHKQICSVIPYLVKSLQMPHKVLSSIHPSVLYHSLCCTLGPGAGTYPKYHRAKAGLLPGKGRDKATIHTYSNRLWVFFLISYWTLNHYILIHTHPEHTL